MPIASPEISQEQVDQAHAEFVAFMTGAIEATQVVREDRTLETPVDTPLGISQEQVDQAHAEFVAFMTGVPSIQAIEEPTRRVIGRVETTSVALTNKPAPPAVGWPDGAPAVAVDIALGKRYKNFEVDPYKLTDLLVELGADPTEVSKRTYHFKRRTPFGTAGVYKNESKDVEVSGWKPSTEALIHESKHAADHTRGLLPNKQERIRAHMLATLIGGLGGVVVANLVAPGFGSIGPWLGATYGASIGQTVRYYTWPHERRACAAGADTHLQEKYQDIVITNRKKR